MQSTRYLCQILIKFEFSLQMFEKFLNLQFCENPFSDSLVVPCGRTDLTKPIAAFRNFANALENGCYTPCLLSDIHRNCTEITKETHYSLINGHLS